MKKLEKGKCLEPYQYFYEGQTIREIRKLTKQQTVVTRWPKAHWTMRSLRVVTDALVIRLRNLTEG